MPVRQAFAGSVQILQALCGDCHSEKTLRKSAQPTSLESRVAPGVMEHARSPKLPPLVFEAQASQGRAVRRRGRGALQAQRALAHPVPGGRR